MRNLKKFLGVVLVLFVVSNMVFCGKKADTSKDNDTKSGTETTATDGAEKEDKADDTTAAAGETVDVGDFTVTCPSGWKAFPALLPGGTDQENDPSVIQICKGGEEATDLFSKPYVHIKYFNPDIEMLRMDKDMLDEEAKDLEPVTIGNFQLDGFYGNSFGIQSAYLYTMDGNANLSITLLRYGDEEDSINLQDAGVQEIISSISCKVK